MNSFAIVFLAALACTNAGLIAAPAARIIQGPSSSATVVGPDGSAISSVAPGGRIVASGVPGLVAAPVVAAAPGLLSSGIVARSALVGGATVLAGPSGTITAAQPLAAAPLLW